MNRYIYIYIFNSVYLFIYLYIILQSLMSLTLLLFMMYWHGGFPIIIFIFFTLFSMLILSYVFKSLKCLYPCLA